MSAKTDTGNINSFFRVTIIYLAWKNNEVSSSPLLFHGCVLLRVSNIYLEACIYDISSYGSIMYDISNIDRFSSPPTQFY